MTEVSDAALVEGALHGDEKAFAELVRRHQALVSRTVCRTLGRSSETEDAVQEVFLRVYTSLRRFDRNCRFEPWIVSITTNYCIDQLRQRSRRLRVWVPLEPDIQERILENLTLNGDFEFEFTKNPVAYQRQAEQFLQELKPKYRTAFVLREVQEMEYVEVAKALGISKLTARVRVCRARRELQRRFQEFLGKPMDGSRKPK